MTTIALTPKSCVSSTTGRVAHGWRVQRAAARLAGEEYERAESDRGASFSASCAGSSAPRASRSADHRDSDELSSVGVTRLYG